MATKAKPAAASSKTPPKLEEKKSAASDTELKQRGLDDALFTLLKQLSRTALHSTTSLQAVIDVLDKEEYRTIEEVKLITMDHLKEWFPGARKTQDVLLKLFSASSPSPAQPSEQTAPLTPMKNHVPTDWAPSPTTTTAIKAMPMLIQEFLKENKELNRKAREELKEELNAQILRLAPPVTMSAGTAAARVEDLEKTHRLRRNVEPHWMQHLQCMPSTEDPWAKVLPSGSREQKVVQPHVSTVLATHACLPTKLRMMDTHKRISFLTRKPDICVYPAGCCSEETQPSSWYLVALGDVKERREKAEFDNDEIGKIIDFLQDLLRVRPDRRTVTGFLTDSCFIQFITLTVVLSATRVEIAWVDLTPVYSLVRGNATRGGDRLYTLLMQEPPELGLPFSELSVDNAVLSITRYLGEGSSSVVWQGTHPTAGDVVVKMFREGHEKDLEKERENLGKVANLAGVTKLVGVNKDSRILLLSPVGTPFHARRQGGAVLPKAEHFAQLLDIVENSHKPPVTLLHRDLSLNNFFIAPGGRVFLNDWAAAVPLHEAHHFYGALFFAADAVLTAHDTKLVGLPRHDLEMIVKVMFAAVHPEFFDERFAALDMHKKPDTELAVKRWAQVRKMEHWRLLFAAAEEANYALLKELIRKYLPRGDEPQESDTAVPAAAQLLPSVLGAVRPQLASGGDSPPEVRTWEEFEKKVTSLWDTCSFVDHGGYPDCFFHCVLALLDRSLIPAGVIATTKQLRATLADQLATRASPPDNFNFIRDTVVQLLAGLVNDWKEYLNRLRDGSLYGGDLEVSAVVEWMKSRGRKLRIRVWTPARAEPQDHGAEDAETVWQLALMQAHYRVVKFMREEQKP